MSEQHPISRFPIPDVSTLPDDLRTRIETLQEKMGFIPNVFLGHAHRPNQLRAFLAMHDDLMESDEGLSRAEREMIVVATSSANQCLYCLVSHGAFLRIRSKQPWLSDQVAANYRDAEISDRQRAMLDYAVKLAQTPWLVGRTISTPWSRRGSPRMKSGTLAPSPACSPCPTALQPTLPCDPMPSSMAWLAEAIRQVCRIIARTG